MRRFARIVLTVMLCLIAGGASLCAYAESAGQILTVNVVAQPDALIEPGEVTLRFTVENPSGYDVENISLTSADGLDSEPVGRVSSGDAESFTRIHSVTQDELDAGEIRYILSHDDPVNPDTKVNYGIRAVLNRADKRISAALIRRFSTTTPASGGTVTAVYRVRNTGNVSLTQLRVQDALGDFSGSVERLEPNESALLISRVTVSEPTVSHAALLYCAETGGDETYTLELEDVPIEIAAPEIRLSFTAEPAAFSADTVQAVLILENTGSVDYESIAVTDDLYGGVLAENLRLPTDGEPLEVEHAYAMRGDEGYRWRVTGRCADGSALDAVTETVKLPTPEKTPAQLILTAETNLPRIRRAGDVRVRARLENVGGTDLENGTVTDAERGGLYTFAVLPAGNSIEREFVFHVDDDTAFNLTASAEADGERITASADEVRVTIASDGALPEGGGAKLIEFSGGSIKIGGSSTFAALLIAGAAILLVLIVMLSIASRRARFEKQVRIAVEKRSRSESGKGRSK